MDLFDNKIGGAAKFSECGKYRFFLSRIWDSEKPIVMFIGLNPSTANATEDDPTIRRVQKLASQWGYGGVYMLNCFPLISPYPEALEVYKGTTFQHEAWTNKYHIRKAGSYCDEVIFAWGAFPIVKETGRDQELIRMFPFAKALVLNKDGSPRHPLYVPSNTQLVRFLNTQMQ